MEQGEVALRIASDLNSRLDVVVSDRARAGLFPGQSNYPGDAPYGFLAPAGLNFDAAAPNNTGGPPSPPPFPGAWLHFSWSVENWAATADVGKGSNLLAWARSFMVRFKEGA